MVLGIFLILTHKLHCKTMTDFSCDFEFLMMSNKRCTNGFFTQTDILFKGSTVVKGNFQIERESTLMQPSNFKEDLKVVLLKTPWTEKKLNSDMVSIILILRTTSSLCLSIRGGRTDRFLAMLGGSAATRSSNKSSADTTYIVQQVFSDYQISLHKRFRGYYVDCPISSMNFVEIKVFSGL